MQVTPGPGECSVQTVTDYAAFLDLKDVWNETVERAGIGHPFLRHEWLRTWWECFGGGCRLHILMMKFGNRIVAIAPLLRDNTRIYGVPVRRLRLLHNDHTPRADVIVAERPEESYRAMWRALQEACEPWDVLQFGQLPPESPAREILPRLAMTDGHAAGIWRCDDSPYLELKSSWDEYLASLTPKFRQNLRNRLTRLQRFGEPRLQVVDHRAGATGSAAISAACEQAVRLEASGWKQTVGTAIGSDPTIRRFYGLFAQRAAEQGWLRLLFLTVNGRAIATAYALQYRRRLLLVKTGYDPTYAKCSPFKILTYFALREAIGKGLAEFDFLGDAEPWKLEWTKTTRPHDWVFIFSGTRRARLLYFAKFRLLPAMRRYRAAARFGG
jgi:CelD/BcsL family acetyltransferase involved in cellulose biosynthesis